jgi:transmembrane sensor
MSAPDLRDRLEPAYDEAQIAQVWDRIASARRGGGVGGRRVMRWLVPLGVTVAAAIVAIAMGVGAPDGRAAGLASRDGSIALVPGAVVHAIAEPRAIELDDRSRVELAPATRLEVLANDGARFVTLLAIGRARFDVTPGGTRLWSVETAAATIDVLGTSFTIEQRHDAVLVGVERGVVVVRGERVPGRVARLTAGQQLSVPRAVTAAASPGAPEGEGPLVVEGEAPPIVESEASPVVVREAPPVVEREAPPVVVREAPAVVVREATPVEEGPGPVPNDTPAPLPASPAPAAHASAPVETLANVLADADRLRAAGQAAIAADRLEAAIAAAPSDPGAGVAAFMLGRLALDTLHDPARAARAFSLVIANGTPHSLVEDAHARRTEALIRAGDRRAAQAAIDAYERAYPGGRRAASLRALLDHTSRP